MNQTTIVKPYLEKVFPRDKSYCVFDSSRVDNDSFCNEMFNSEYWQTQNSIIGTAQGRGTTWFVKFQQQNWVLRHYYRGGLVGRFIRDKYWFAGIKKTRAAREFTLLNTLQTLNLPAPKAIAYQVIKKGFYYQADLLTERIMDANDLVALLSKQQLSKELWYNIGVTIRRFHHHGIYHHDLNAHNILIDQQERVWIIDFDRGEKRDINSQWQQANMNRLLRSFNKEKNKLVQFSWHESQWVQLMAGYNA